MSLLEQQHILARLYTDADFRHRFLKDPTKIGAESGLHANEIAEIASIAPELKFFSESLIAKRLNEAAKMLPVLRRLLAAKFHPAFVAFAPTFNPRSLKKHFEDAIEFCSFIDGDSGYSDLVKDAARFERARLLFLNGSRMAAFCRLRHDLRPAISGDDQGNAIPPMRPSVAFWFRIGGRVRHFFW